MPESYLVIGGCGFLGRCIVEQLLARGETEVSVFDIVQRHFDSNVTFYIGDISKKEDVSNAIVKSRATAVFHTASPIHGLGEAIYNLVNVTGTENVIEACQNHGVKKLVYTSSGGVVYNGEQQITSADERLDYPEKPLDAYNGTKVAAEKMVLAANSDKLLTCSIRPAGIMGPGDRQVIQGFYGAIPNGQTRFQIGNNLNLQDFTYVDNVAVAHLLAVDKLHTVYPYSGFRDPLPGINLSLGNHKIPTSDSRPLGPNTSPTEADLLAARRFEAGESSESDVRPVLRNRMDQFGDAANNEDEEGGIPVAGQAFFITNGEPTFFWDLVHTVWASFGHIPPSIWVLPTSLGDVVGAIGEYISKFTGRQPGLTRFRVAILSLNRYYDIEKARRLLGYTPVVGFDEGVKRWTAWYAGELQKQQSAVETEKTK